MANRINVNVNVNDLSRSGLANVRSSLRRMQRDVRQAGGDVRFNVVIPPDATRRQIRRMTRMLRREPVTLTTRLNPPNIPSLRRRMLTALGRGLTIPVRVPVNTIRRQLLGLRGTVSGILQDGIGQGIINGMRAGGPVFAALLLAAIMGAMSLIGAALAGALVLVIGGAVAGLGIFLAAQSEKVKKDWGDTLGELKVLFRDAARPMLPVIEHARKVLLDMGREFAPKFQTALDSMRGPLMRFTDSLAAGFRKLTSRAGGDLTAGFNAFLAAFGPQFEGFMAGLGDSLGALARTVRDHSFEIAVGLRMVLSLITTVIDIINFFANAWVMASQAMIEGQALLADGWAMLADKAMDAFALILTAADTALSWIPDWDNSIGRARDSFDVFRDRVVEDLNGSGDAIRQLGQTIEDQNARNKLKADISVLEAKVRTAKASLQTVTDKKTQAKVKADISNLNSQLAAARSKLADLNGRTANVYVRGAVYFASTPGDKDANGVPDYIQAPGRRMGGIIGAATGGVRSNMTLVGEQGPELVDLPAGSRVRSNPDTARMMGGGFGGAGSAQPLVAIIQIGEKKIGEVLIDPLRKEIAARGGNVQATLGRRTGR